jgi:hypothetical protein
LVRGRYSGARGSSGHHDFERIDIAGADAESAV